MGDIVPLDASMRAKATRHREQPAEPARSGSVRLEAKINLKLNVIAAVEQKLKQDVVAELLEKGGLQERYALALGKLRS